MAIQENVPLRLGLRVLFVHTLLDLMPVIGLTVITAVFGALMSRFDLVVQYFSLTPNGASIGMAILGTVFLIGLIGTAIFGFVVILYAVLAYYFYTYTITEFGVQINQGIIYKEDISISYRQIRNVNITQPLLYLIFGVARTEIYTLTNADDAVSFNKGIDTEITLQRDIAEEVQNYLVKRSNVGEIIELPGGMKIDLPERRI